MTTLAAIQGDGWVVMGCDSRASDEGGRVMDLASSKIIINGNYMIAVSGASRGGNIAQFGWTPPKPPATSNRLLLDKFVTRKLIPSLRDAFIKAGYEGKEDGEAAWHDSDLLIAFNGVIYPIFSDYSWDREVRNIYYSGSGGDVALGALVALGIEKANTPEKAERIVFKAVEIATKWDAYCSPPIITMIQYE